MAEKKFIVNGKEYAVPTSFDIGEIVDAERFFGVDFSAENQSARAAAANLYIAIRREDPTVTVEDIRALPLEVFKAIGTDEVPENPPSAEDDSGLSEPSGQSSAQPSAITQSPSDTGSPGSDTGSVSAPATLGA